MWALRRGRRGRPRGGPSRPGPAEGRHGPGPQRLPSPPTGRSWSRPPAPPRRDGPDPGHRRVVALRLRRRARPPLDRRAAGRLPRQRWRTRETAGLRPEVRHIANSPATLTLPESHFDLVRTGHRDVRHLARCRELGGPADFGLRPGDDAGRPARAGQAGPGRPRRQLRAPLHRRRRDHAGAGAARLRGRHAAARLRRRARCWWRASGARSRAGWRWTSSWWTSAATPRRPGDEAVLFGPGDRGEPTAEDWARAAGTIAYEIVTRIGARVPRVYVHGRLRRG